MKVSFDLISQLFSESEILGIQQQEDLVPTCLRHFHIDEYIPSPDLGRIVPLLRIRSLSMFLSRGIDPKIGVGINCATCARQTL